MMPARCPVSDVSRVLELARRTGAWTVSTRAALFHDLDRIEGRLDDLAQAFPQETLHAIAIKANPLIELLKLAVDRGHGLEAATWEEVECARAAGCPPDRIVYDSPAKTEAELRAALQLGVWLNADSEGELERLHALGASRAHRIGLRVNPQLGEGRIAATSTIGRASHFGVPLDHAPALAAAYPFISGLHVHTGSQGVGLALLQQAAQAVGEVAESLDLDWVDVGGGVPVRYTDQDPEPPTFAQWGESLQTMPGWGTRRLITEVGRSIHAGSGWALTRIETVKDTDGQPTLVGHLGADLLLRRVYRPEDWSHSFVLLDADGQPRTGDLRPTRIAGPLCFSGDLLARDCPLPAARPGDLLLIRDTGAYTLSMWSRHCSRGLPASWGYRRTEMTCLHRGEKASDVAEFWSLKPPGA